MEWLICNNFQKGDYLVTLTYEEMLRPDNCIDAYQQLRRVLNNTRNALSRKNISFYYFASTEHGQERGGVHHHIIVRNTFDIEQLTKRWKYGKVHVKTITTDFIFKLSEYILKSITITVENLTESLDMKLVSKYSHSRNLIKPEVEKHRISVNEFNEIPQAEKGYYMVKEPHTMVQGENGYLCQEYIQAKVVSESSINNPIF